jgi:hypothetical protein
MTQLRCPLFYTLLAALLGNDKKPQTDLDLMLVSLPTLHSKELASWPKTMMMKTPSTLTNRHRAPDFKGFPLPQTMNLYTINLLISQIWYLASLLT